MSEEAPAPERKVIVTRRLVRREKDSILGIDMDTIHWVITGLSVAGLGAVIAKDYMKQQEEKRDREAYEAAMASQQQQPEPQQMPQEQPQQQQPTQVPENFYPDNMSNTINRSTLDDSNSGTYVTDADGTRRKIKSRFGDVISVA